MEKNNIEKVTVSKTGLVDMIAGEVDIPKSKITALVDATLVAITNTLKSGGTVSLSGFGSFSTADREARTGRNPRSGDVIQIAATRIVKFRVGKNLKDVIADTMVAKKKTVAKKK